MFSVMRAYLPEGTDPVAVENMMLGHGGFTTIAGAQGTWRAPDGTVIDELVVVYECVAEIPASTALQQLSHAGRTFLSDNREEQAFMGIVIGDGVHQVYVEAGGA